MQLHVLHWRTFLEAESNDVHYFLLRKSVIMSCDEL